MATAPVDGAAPAGRKSVLQQAQGSYVAFLNAKLTKFSRPFCLAIVISVCNLIFFVGMFAGLLSVCPVEKYSSLQIAPMKQIDWMQKTGAISCMQMVGYIFYDTRIGFGGGASQPILDVNSLSEQHGMVNFSGCKVDTTQTEWDWCETHLDNDNNEADGALYAAINGHENWPSCPHRNDGGSNDGTIYAFYFDKRVCRNAGEALGLALAYTAYCDMIVTLLALAIGLKMGMISIVGGGSLRESVMAAVNEDDDEKKSPAGAGAEGQMTRAQVQLMIDQSLMMSTQQNCVALRVL